MYIYNVCIQAHMLLPAKIPYFHSNIREFEKQGKQWDINPPLASHFGGVWERAIGNIRQILHGYVLPIKERVLTRKEFMSFLLCSAQIMNSTPLHDPPESPNEPN